MILIIVLVSSLHPMEALNLLINCRRSGFCFVQAHKLKDYCYFLKNKVYWNQIIQEIESLYSSLSIYYSFGYCYFSKIIIKEHMLCEFIPTGFLLESISYEENNTEPSAHVHFVLPEGHS